MIPLTKQKIFEQLHMGRRHSYRGPKLWTQIPSNIKNSSTLGEFKAKIKSWKPVECKCRLCKRFISNLGFIS